MKNFLIDRFSFSDLFWNEIFFKGAHHIDSIRSIWIDRYNHFEKLRTFADYDTGSISLSTSVCITLLTSYFRPKIIAEVGTFIGRSTFSFALTGFLHNIPSPKIYTCDYSNDISLDFDPIFNNVIQFKRRSSVEMFQSILSRNEFPDFYSIDGRISQEDIHFLKLLNSNRAIFIIDDFEGIEKGVVNASKILDAFLNNFMLIYPPSLSFLNNFSLKVPCTSAVLIPKNMLLFVNQSG